MLKQLLGLAGDLLQLGGKTLVILIVLLLAIPLILVLIGVVGPVAAAALLILWPIAGAYCTITLRRYLRSKLAPVFAAAAVTLCTAMVIIVISVMGGFLTMLEGATKTLEGDITITSGLTGFPYYEELLADLEKAPEVAAVSPMISSYGLIKLNDDVRPIQVDGIDPTSFNRVINYRTTLYWKTSHVLEFLKDVGIGDESGFSSATQPARALTELARELKPEEAGMNLEAVPRPAWSRFYRPDRFDDPGKPMPGLVLGIEWSRGNRRDRQGQYHLRDNRTLGQTVFMTLLPLTTAGNVFEAPKPSPLVVVNEFKSGLYEFDKSRAYAPLGMVQRMLNMDQRSERDADTGAMVDIPARVTDIVVRGRDNIALATLDDKVREVSGRFVSRHPGVQLYAQTWRQRNATFLGAVAHEKLLVTILFAIVSIVAFTMIAVVFYMIVLDKTRDIGTLRAVGASRAGIAGVFLGYGLAIGIVGAMLGLAVATAVVLNINELQAFLGRTIGFEMWNPEVYYFDRIPSRIDIVEVALIVTVAIASSVVGAIIPALRAASLNPVEALRYE